MKKLFNLFMKRNHGEVLDLPTFYRAEKTSTMFNAWMVASLNRPTEFANAFMIRKFLQKLDISA